MADIGKVLQGMNRLPNLNLEHAIRMPEIHIPRMLIEAERPLPDKDRALIPEYVKDYVSLNQFAA